MKIESDPNWIVTNRMLYLCGIVVAIVSATALRAQENRTSRLTYGPHAVGFRVVCDTSGRAAPASEQLLIWYPARRPVSSPTMRFIEYLAPSGELECGAAPATDEQRQLVIDGLARQLAAAGGPPGEAGPIGGRLLPNDSALGIAQALTAATTAAFPSAEPIRGTFPIVVFAAAGAIEQPILLESLASHGYVVVTFPHAGSPPSGLARLGVESGATRDVTMANEIGRAIDATVRFGNADRTRVAVIANGGFVPGAIWFQARTRRLSALVVQEGRVPGARPRSAATSSIGFRVGPSDTLPTAFAQEWSVPVLDWQPANNDYTRGVLETFVRAERIRLDVQAAHPSDWAARRLVHPSDAVANTPNDVLSVYVRQFLAYALEHRPGATAFFDRTPEANGVRPGFLTVDRQPPSRPSTTRPPP